jgi:uncharacterized protein YxjI
MGTPATTRIANENDYIEHHTRWDGFPEEIKDKMISMSDRWEFAIEQLKEKLNDDNQGTVGLTKWVEDFEQALIDYKTNPKIDMSSMLLCFHSFAHHHVLPTKTNDDILSYLGEDSPDITAQILNGEFTYTFDEDGNQPVVEVIRKEIPAGFKVMRIHAIDDDGKLVDDNYVDFKYKNISEDDLFASIIHLPLFLRDIYTLTKMTRTEKKSLVGQLDPLTMLLQKMAEFYKPTTEYVRFSSSEVDAIRTKAERLQSIQESLEAAHSMIPFDLDITSFGSQIAFANPGNVLPLTKGEQLSEYDISFKVGLFESRLNYIYCNIPNKEENDMLALLNDVVLHFDYRMHRFNTYHKVDNIGDNVQFSKLLSDEVFFGMPYEATIINLMENQQSMEMNELLESKE